MRTSYVLLFLLLFATAAQGAVIDVRQDGTGDYVLIADAMAAATPGDVLDIGPGVYPEALELTKSLTLQAEMGLGSVTLDGGGSFRPLWMHGAVTVTLTDLKFTNAYGDNGSALLIWEGAQVTVTNCEFSNNYAWESNAVHVRNGGTNVTFTGCHFIGNVSNIHSGALGVGYGCTVTVDGCVFADNSAGAVSGAANAHDAHLDVRNSLFVRNSAQGTGALVYTSASGSVVGNTFHDNSGHNNGSVYISGAVDFDNNIITAERNGYGLVDYSSGSRSNNLYWENALGSIAHQVPGGDEIEQDPLFCDYPLDNYALCVISPALAAVNGVGLIGAYDQGCDHCGPVATESRSWGDLKAAYR